MRDQTHVHFPYVIPQKDTETKNFNKIVMPIQESVVYVSRTLTGSTCVVFGHDME